MISSSKLGVDALAVAIGTSHGAYKFTRKPTGEILAISRIEEIHRRLPNTHLVMHGSSSVPQELLEIINQQRRQNPRNLRRTCGRNPKGHSSAVFAKSISILTTVWRLPLRCAKLCLRSPTSLTPATSMKPSIKYMQKVCSDRYQSFGAAGHGTNIKQISLDDFAAKYAKGELKAISKSACGCLRVVNFRLDLRSKR